MLHSSSACDSMTRDGEISAIFNPRRVRAPSVVVTGDSPNGQFGGFTNLISTGSPHLIHSDSIASGHPDVADTVCVPGNNTTSAGTPTPTEIPPTILPILPPVSGSNNMCKDSCCSDLAQKVLKLYNHNIGTAPQWPFIYNVNKFVYI